MRGFPFLLVFVCLVLASPAFGQRVNESESTVTITGNVAIARLVVDDERGGRTVNAQLELLDVADTVKASVAKQLTLLRGKNTFEFPLTLGRLVKESNDELTWLRLRYSIGDVRGIVSLSQLIRDLFELRVIAADNILSGTIYRVRIRALNPFTDHPAADVGVETNVSLELRGDGGRKLELKGNGVTDANGFAVIDLTIPPEVEFDGDGEIKVIGQKAGIVREAQEDLEAMRSDVQILSMTDKPIYQPGQTLNIRGIVLKGAETKVVVANSEIEFRIEDEDDTLLYREKVRSSEFGVASIAWRIPSNARLGDYLIEIRDSAGDEISHHQVKVSRYDLPNFVVNAKPSKPYFLPEDKEAEVEIRADYLFGKPVTRGKVRVVEETDRTWSWKEQKYIIDEGQVREGETDAEGKFTAKFDLSENHDSIRDSDWQKFRDIKFAAYFTDPTTNKTEQRRFDIRVTREPIHVYLIRGEDFGNSRLPLVGYVSTFYADGTPAECDVEIKASEEGADKFKTFAKLKTNSLGAEKFTMPRPNIGDLDDDLDFRVLAKDKHGRRGTHEENIYFDDDEEDIRVFTNRAIYKPGETVDVKLLSTVRTGTVYVDIVSGWSVIDSRFATLKDGKAELKIPYKDNFKGELKIAAFIEAPNDDDDLVKGGRGIIFPAKEGIKVDAKFDKAVYKPNEEATVRFGILDVVGKAVESALGVVVFDKAVEERARTDSDFGGMVRGLSGWLGYGKGFGGINIKDLNELDLSKPISDELQSAAEIILHDSYYYPNTFHSKRYYDEASSAFGVRVSNQFNEIRASLSHTYSNQKGLHAVDEAGLTKILDSFGLDLAAMRDPWGTAYRPEFAVDKTRDIVRIKTAGPDKVFDTRDDFTAFSEGYEYFTSIGKAIDTTVRAYHSRNGNFIRDDRTLYAEMGVEQLVDRFGRPYKVHMDADGRNIRIRIISAGPDGKFENADYDYGYSYGDDFIVWTSSLDVFATAETKITEIQRALRKAPLTEAQFRQTLKDGGMDFDKVRDGNDNPLYITVNQRSRYWDKVTIESVQIYGDTRRTERSKVTPVTQQVIEFTIRGNGRDRKPNTNDDVTFTQYVHVLTEQSKEDPQPVPVMKPITYSPNAGSISGTVTDDNGAVIAGATVTATNSTTGFSRSATTNDNGSFLITNLEAGTYTVIAEAPAFKRSIISNVPVKAGSVANVDIALNGGGVSETVSVTAEAATLNSTDASVSVTSRQLQSLPISGSRAISNALLLQPGTAKGTKLGDSSVTEQETATPRLREYFPETLLWQPQIVTDANGKAEVKFRMADNITTWKMYTIASTKNGKIGFAEKEVTAFQAFFVDLDPPKFLTTGDEIYLPTQVRNYTDKKQKVNVTMEDGDWFSLVAGATRQVAVDSGQTENAVFGFRAATPVKDGKQRVTAVAQTDSDAIERSVTVRPDGREVVHTESRYFKGNEKLNLDFPARALPRTQTAELKIYPNLMSHIAEAVEGLLQRPYGCGEQTISSTYPNLMILKFARRDEKTGNSEAIERRARKFLQSGYERLLGYQVGEGGFSYWGGKDAADIALTAYALRFLADASLYIAVDPDVVKKAEGWLVRQQHTDGSWNQKYRWETVQDERRAKTTTTYVARTLGMLASSKRASINERDSDSQLSQAVTKALSYLKTRNTEIDDPYSLALLGLAAFDSGDAPLAGQIAKQLAGLAKEEAGASYWNLETNTVFNGWGSAGRVETTALVTQLFLKMKVERELVGKAMIFLLQNKDRYGVWYSTQTTINVLDAFVTSLVVGDQPKTNTVDVILNGQRERAIEIGPDKLDQIVVDLDSRLAPENNVIELKTGDSTPLMAQLVTKHYVAWRDADTYDRTLNQSRALSLGYKCDRMDPAIMQEVTCAVEAERIGYQGYGMLLAEIGTPPGADVSRESLAAAMENDTSISRYDILPDRIVLYMWSKPGGTKFSFKFRPRYGIDAKTPASSVYDYYNPEAQATVSPLRFTVR
ncbi:MAG TPA: MG2 domain-containing protein [Pyrinomonadaceae bacterium]|nr:MG2 domain-containing protein [Pyrinomonadaceae bacterium]HRK49652.1 MG2 domain-containing protein [Pyrinomonadaceae bacterium]